MELLQRRAATCSEENNCMCSLAGCSTCGRYSAASFVEDTPSASVSACVSSNSAWSKIYRYTADLSIG